MALKSELMAVGMPASQANRLGYEPVANVTAAGTTQATATLLTVNNANVTTPTVGAGVQVGAEQKYFIYNVGTNVLSVYPVTGGAFSGLGTNVALTIAAGATLLLEGAGLTGAAWSK